jgi:hypothetical protein
MKPHVSKSAIYTNVKLSDPKTWRNYVEQIPRQEADSFSIGKQILRLLGNWAIHYCFYNIPDLALSLLHLSYILIGHFLKSNLIKPSN